MELENSHPLVRLLAPYLSQPNQEAPEVLQSLQTAFEHRGFDNITHIDVSNIAHLIDISGIQEQIQPPLTQPANDLEDIDQFHVFARTTPVRSAQVAGGSNAFLSGTRVQTVGPFLFNDQPPFWIDFIRIQRSVAVFMRGNPVPLLYCKISFTVRPGFITIPKQDTYSIIPTSVWIQAKTLYAFAPADLYAGLKISSGILQITGNFTTDQTGIILEPGAAYSCQLQLLQKTVDPFAGDGLYGKDARDQSIQLPIEFSFSHGGIISVGPLAATIFTNTFTSGGITNPSTTYFAQQQRLAVKLAVPADTLFIVDRTQSPLIDINGQAPVTAAWWALPLAQIQLMQPLEAAGNGALLVECGPGLSANIKNTDEYQLALPAPQWLIEPGRINLTDTLSNGTGKTHSFSLWKDVAREFGTLVELRFLKEASFVFNSLAQGDELVTNYVSFYIEADRPVNIKGEPVALRSDKGVFVLTANETKTILGLADFELQVNKKAGPNDPLPQPKKMALALSNALLTTSLPASVGLQATVSNDFKSLTEGSMEISFGLYSYLPTLPDPYVANLGILQKQFLRMTDTPGIASNSIAGSTVWMWVVAKVSWVTETATLTTNFELLDFYKNKIVTNYRLPFAVPDRMEIEAKKALFIPSPDPVSPDRLPGENFEEKFIKRTGATKLRSRYQEDINPIFTEFALLDVSSNANQMGVAFSHKFPYMQEMIADPNHNPVGTTDFPLKIEGTAVITEGKNAQAFTLPGIAWEPLLNLSLTTNLDPLPGFNYFPNDGVPTLIGNLSSEPVQLAPIPLSRHLVDTFKSKKDGKTYALFNLPFGMVAFAILDQHKNTQETKPTIEDTPPHFEHAIIGGIQLELTAGSSFDNEDGQGLFEGYTYQLANLYDQLGAPAKSTLGATPTEIFNQEFSKGKYKPKNSPEIKLNNRPGVPVTNIGLSGYGTSMASKWANDEAVFAQVSKAEFNVYTGRTSHELVQVVSKEYPFGAKVVRTITIFRMSNGYVARIDSGWKPQTPGLYDFSYLDDDTRDKTKSPLRFHPGVVKGVFNLRNIKEIENLRFDNGFAILQGITYDADILIDNVKEGGNEQVINGVAKILVPSAGIKGYIQLSPLGVPIDADSFTELIQGEGGSIGGSINCVIKVAGTDQYMKLNRFDVAASVDTGGLAVFVSSARGSVFLPKDGSWSLVQHKISNGNVTPLPSQYSVPLIKQGERPDFDGNNIDLYNPLVDISPDALHRIADPANLLIADPAANNYGFLQNMGSQKVLFLTPSFKTGTPALLSKTPPLLADSFKLLNGNAIFPNIGDAVTNFGQAVSLLKAAADGVPNSVDAFKKTGVQDLGKDVYELLQLDFKKEGAKFLEQQYELAKKGVGGAIDKALKFDLPSGDYNLVNLKDKLVISIRYKTSTKRKVDGQPNPVKKDYPGKFDFDVNSAATEAADNWKGKLNNMAVVVSVGPMKDLMTVKGNFNAQKGADLDLGSNSDAGGFNLPTPEIEFSEAVRPVIQILEILASLSTGDYGAALKKGLKIAMSNSGDIWEYKMEASKEIPLVRFPPGPAYDSPQVPLKLECSLKVGFNVNAALKVTSDPGQLLPTAGAFFAFRGRLMVMVVSVGAGSVFAIGEAGIRIEADTSPQVGVILHFGFGAQIAVGLPVVGTASVTFMVGVEVATNSNGKLAITAFMLFKGQAELLGGLVSICIMIEARGTVVKEGPDLPANCEVQVTFAIDVSIFLVINIHFSESWGESRQIA